MDRSSFESAEPLLEKIAERIDQILNSPQFADIRQALAQLSQTVGPPFSVNLDVSVEVFDPQRPHPLPLLVTGVSTSEGKPPHRTWSDSTPQKYLVDGEMVIVPHDRCPKCYGIWDFKWKNGSCSECQATLGKEVRILLDTDICPYCEDGKVSLSSPVCDKCGFRVDPTLVAWG
jgi:Zn-finger nucleic acid-binding protein